MSYDTNPDADLLLLVEQEIEMEEATCRLLRAREPTEPHKTAWQRRNAERKLRRHEVHLAALRMYLESLTGGGDKQM